jgi:hypothetical protein
VFILHRLHTKIYYFVLSINCGYPSLLYYLLHPSVSHTNMFPAVNWPNLLRSANSLLTTKKNRNINIYVCFTADEFRYWRKNCTDENLFF